MASDGYWLGVGWAGLGWGTIPDRVATYDGYIDKVVPQRNRTTYHNKPSACGQNQIMSIMETWKLYESKQINPTLRSYIPVGRKSTRVHLFVCC